MYFKFEDFFDLCWGVMIGENGSYWDIFDFIS